MRFRFFVLVVPFLAAAATAAPPVAVSPGSAQRVSIVAGNCPTFSWGSVAGAGLYELLVYRLGEDSQAALRQEVPGSALSWTPSLDRCLRPGARYAWAVRAIDVVGEIGRWSEPSLFEIAAVPDVEQVRSAMAILTAYLERLEAAPDAASLTETSASEARARSTEIVEGPEAAPRALAVAADTALHAASSATSGVAFGVHGVSKSTGAGSVGVAGESTATSGDVAGVYGQTASAAGAAGVFDNTAFGDILRGLAGGVEIFTVDGTGGVTATGFSGDGAGLTGVTADSADDLDCVACVSAGELDFDAASPEAVETLTADWVNTANPWADDEVSDTLTVGAAGSVDDAALSANVSLLGQTIESSEITDGTVTAADIADGSGSGLDADTLDTIESVAFLQKTEVDTQAELEALLTDVANLLVSTELDSEAELEALVGASFVSSTETAAAANMLAANGSNCPAGQWAAGVDASGNAEGCTADVAGIDHGFATGNTRVGPGALAANTTGVSNTATGSSALASNTAGYDNTAFGREALYYNTAGYSNTAAGRDALRANTTGYRNTAAGVAALTANTTGSYNTAVGETALTSNTSGHRNTAVGRTALRDNSTGYSNAAVGAAALTSNTSGSQNVAQGQFALRYNTTGSRNTALGAHAGENATTGSDNVFLGSGAGGVAGEANTIRIGGSTVGTAPGQQNRAFVNGIRGVSVAGGQTVVVDASGQLGSTAGGAGSGVSADTLDGIDSVAFLQKSELDSEAELEAQVGVSLVSSTETAAAATTLAADGTDCGADEAAGGVDASGNAEECRDQVDLTAFATGNTRVGSGALAANTTGASGTATGYEALTANTTGGKNTAIGARALRANTEGFNNTAIGESALRTNTTGTVNTASGEGALYANLTGSQNTATGRLALSSNTVGDRNTATGYEALANSTGSRNTGVGNRAGINATSGSDNIFLGSGAEGVAAEANTIRIGGSAVGTESGQQNRAFINGIRGVSVAGGQTVVIDAAGQLGSTGGGAGSGVHADTVDGFHAAGAAAANTLLALDGAGRLPASITGDADTVDGKQAADLVAKAGDTMTGTLTLPANGLVAGTSQLVLEGGNVGIGTAVADEPLHVKGESTQVVIEDSMSGADRHLMQLAIGGGEATVAANHVGGTPSLGLKLQVRNSGAPLDAIKILPSGLVGIGDTTPTHRLDVGGDVTVGSETETLANSGFALGGDDLFVAGTAGVEGTIYTDSGVTVGASTTFADGSIAQSTNGSGLAIDVAGGDAAGENFTVIANNISVSPAGALTLADDLTLSAGDLNLPEGAIQDARVVGADIKDGEIGEAKLNLTLIASGEVALAPGAEQEILVDSTYDIGGAYYPLYWVAVNRWRGNDYSGQKFAWELIHRVDSDYWNTKFYLHLTNLNATTPPAGVRYRVYRLD